ncbi:MAG: hypothetical protein J6A08_00210 [Lachnospiraceae bacterium]|nr:hypothetical protein [Lachnospiraceae bacterium]
MIYFYTGTPGSGKSLHMAAEIYDAVWRGKNVIANFPINESYFAKAKHPEKLGRFIYVPNSQWMESAYTTRQAYDPVREAYFRGTVPPDHYTYLDGLYSYALQFHKRDRKGRIIEHQTLLVLDECQGLFNNRSWAKKDRTAWVDFFREHRKYGFDIYLISQDDQVIDKQIRAVLQFKVEHRSVKNYKLAGKLLAFLSGGNLFVWILSNYQIRSRDAWIKSEYFTGRKFYDFYNSYETFHTG